MINFCGVLNENHDKRYLSVFVTYLQQIWLKFVAEYKLHTNKKGNILQQNGWV